MADQIEYWKDTKTAELFDKANTALFDLHRHLDLQIKTEDWRNVYKMRCDLGSLERVHSLRLGYKDGRIVSATVQPQFLDVPNPTTPKPK